MSRRSSGFFYASLFKARSAVPGILVCMVVALAAGFLSDHHGGPSLLYALMLGLAFNFLASHEQLKAGIAVCARLALRVGVALLGARITIHQIAELGLSTAATVIAGVTITILSGIFLARILRRPLEEGIISGCAVGICGASAALAVSAVLPASRENERYTLLAVVGVTILSTLAMVIYPLLLTVMGVDARSSGIFLGGSVHDVAQVVASAMLLGKESADTAVIVKLFRVAMLAPVAMLIALAYRRNMSSSKTSRRPQLIPGFLLVFAVLVALSSMGFVSQQGLILAGATSKWLLMVAIAAAGVKTNLGELAKLGWTPVVMLVSETVIIATFTLILIRVLS